MATTSNAGDELKEVSRPLLQPSTSTSPIITITPAPTETRSQSSIFRQIFLGVIIALPSLPCGMSLGFSAASFEQLALDVDDATWFASITFMAIPIGCLLVGKTMDMYGRRPALLAINIISMIGWLMLSVPSSNPSLFKLLTGRILTGIAVGFASVPAAVYAAECLCSTDLSIRSALVTWSTVALSAGIFVVYLTGAFLDYYNVASIATLTSILSLILVAIFVPESPVWLSMKGRHGDAEWSQREINISPPPKPIEQPSEAEDFVPPPTPPPPPQPETLKELLKPEAYKPLLIMIGFLFFQQFSGIYVMIAYMVDIVRASGVITLSPYTVTVIGGTIILIVSLLASMVYPSTGVRSIAAFSGAGTTATMLFIGTFLSIRQYWITNDDLYFLHWVPVLAILTNIGVSTIGFLILPWSMLGEVFPINVKGMAGGIATCCGFIFSFVVLKVYPYIQLGLGVSGVFFFFGSMGLLGTIFVIFFLPETKGKTLQEIVDSFSTKTKRRKI